MPWDLIFSTDSIFLMAVGILCIGIGGGINLGKHHPDSEKFPRYPRYFTVVGAIVFGLGLVASFAPVLTDFLNNQEIERLKADLAKSVQNEERLKSGQAAAEAKVLERVASFEKKTAELERKISEQNVTIAGYREENNRLETIINDQKNLGLSESDVEKVVQKSAELEQTVANERSQVKKLSKENTALAKQIQQLIANNNSLKNSETAANRRISQLEAKLEEEVKSKESTKIRVTELVPIIKDEKVLQDDRRLKITLAGITASNATNKAQIHLRFFNKANEDIGVLIFNRYQSGWLFTDSKANDFSIIDDNAVISTGCHINSITIPQGEGRVFTVIFRNRGGELGSAFSFTGSVILCKGNSETGRTSVSFHNASTIR